MANHIAKLTSDRQALQETVAAASEQAGDFIAFLHSAKFAGQAADGSRKDWIATADVIAWLRTHRATLQP